MHATPDYGITKQPHQMQQKSWDLNKLAVGKDDEDFQCTNRTVT